MRRGDNLRNPRSPDRQDAKMNQLMRKFKHVYAARCLASRASFPRLASLGSISPSVLSQMDCLELPTGVVSRAGRFCSYRNLGETMTCTRDVLGFASLAGVIFLSGSAAAQTLISATAAGSLQNAVLAASASPLGPPIPPPSGAIPPALPGPPPVATGPGGPGTPPTPVKPPACDNGGGGGGHCKKGKSDAYDYIDGGVTLSTLQGQGATVDLDTTSTRSDAAGDRRRRKARDIEGSP